MEYITSMVVNPESLVRKLVSLTPAMVTKIENYRFEKRIRTESEAIRRLIERGLALSVEELVQECIDSHRIDIADMLRELASIATGKKSV